MALLEQVISIHTKQTQGRENYLAPIRTLIKSSGIYALGSVTAPLVTLVLSPFLAHNLSSIEFGALAVLTTVIALIAGAAQLGLSSAFFRAYSYDYESSNDRMAVLSTVVFILALTSVPIALTMVFAAPWLALFLLRTPSLSHTIQLAALVILLQNLTVPGFAVLRAENRAVFFVILSLMNLLVSLIMTLFLVGGLHMGISGSLLATGAGYCVVVIATLPAIFLKAGLRLRITIAWELIAFGLPNVFNFLAMWILQLSDRFLLARLGSLTQTASYAVAYSLGGAIGVVVLSPFSLAWPSFMFPIAKRDDAPQVFKRIFRWYSLLLLLITNALILVATAVLDIFYPPSYQATSPIIPIIAVSIMLNGIYSFVGSGIGIRKKTWFAVVFTSIAAITNISCNIILIPLYGAMGAAIATLIAYIALTWICYVVTQRVYPIPFEIRLFLLAAFIGAGLYGGSELLERHVGTYAAWIIAICNLLLYGGCLAFLARLPDRKNPTMTLNQ